MEPVNEGNDNSKESNKGHRSFTTDNDLGLELAERSNMFLGSVADAAAGGGFGKPLMSDEAEVGGDDHNGNCNGNVDEIDAYNYNEDEDNGAIFASRDFKLQGEEHMVSRKEDDWVRTFAGVAGNVLEW
mmetsp:Transcript_5555/g.11517  ORF Transcript_5555/g.11517 Transcript_5555/m.11517 type:complete len:129 (-) Transcript_5555:18-404(-)